jgi:hypothetical protein
MIGQEKEAAIRAALTASKGIRAVAREHGAGNGTVARIAAGMR